MSYKMTNPSDKNVKKEIAQHVQRLILDTNWNLIIAPIGERVNDAMKVTEYQTIIHIRTTQGPRHFVVKVSESI